MDAANLRQPHQIPAPPIQIGVFLSLTGEMQPYGINAQNGLTLAEEEINARGGIQGRHIELVVVDDRGSQRDTLEAVKQLIDRRKLKIVIGGLTSSGMRVTERRMQRKGRCCCSLPPPAPDIPQVGTPYFVRNWQSDTIAAEAAATFARNELKAKKASIIYVNNAYGQGLYKGFRDRFAALQGVIVLERGFPQGDTTTIRTLLTAAIAAQPDVLFVPAYPVEYREVLHQAKNLKLSLPIIATDTFDDPGLIASLKDEAEGVHYVVAAPTQPDYEPAAEFRKKYSARFAEANGSPKQPGLASDTSYDALHLVADAIASHGEDPLAVAQAIRARKDYPGAAGITNFTEMGDVVKPVVVNVVKGGDRSSCKECRHS